MESDEGVQNRSDDEVEHEIGTHKADVHEVVNQRDAHVESHRDRIDFNQIEYCDGVDCDCIAAKKNGSMKISGCLVLLCYKVTSGDR